MESKPKFCGKDQCLDKESQWAYVTKGQLPGEEGLGLSPEGSTF